MWKVFRCFFSIFLFLHFSLYIFSDVRHGRRGKNQDLWVTITSDSGGTLASTPTDTLTIAGGTNITTSISGDTVTINTTGAADQNLWLTITSDAGGTTANTTTDTLTIAGALLVSTAVSGDVLTVTGTANHDTISGFVTAEHVDWAAASAGTIHITNYIENVDQNLFVTISSSSGSRLASSTTDTMNFVGGPEIATSIVSNTMTIDVTDSFFFNTGDIITGIIDFGGATEFEIPNSTSPSVVESTGNIALDTDGNILNVNQGVILAFDGTNTMLNFGTTLYPDVDNHVMAFNQATNAVTWEAQVGGTTNLLSEDKHLDTITTSAVAGAFVMANASDIWSRLLAGTADQYITIGSSLPEWDGLNIVDDTTPQLGGDLTSNGNDIAIGSGDTLLFGLRAGMALIPLTITVTVNLNNQPILGASQVELDNTTGSSLNISGFSVISDHYARLVNTSAQDIVLLNQSLLSLVNNRFQFSTNADITLKQNYTIDIYHDSSVPTAIWRNVALPFAGIENVVEDVTPQLGANLDANTFSVLFDDDTGMFDSAGNEVLVTRLVTDAINYVQLSNAAGGSDPRFLAQGDDTNISVDAIGKGTGVWDFSSGISIEDGTGATVFSTGQIAIDTNGNATGVNQGVLLVHDGTVTVLNFGTTTYPTTDNQVMAYDTATSTVTWQAQAGGGASLNQADDSAFSGASPTSWTDLNLSSIVGANTAMVVLAIDAGADINAVAVRRNGDTTEYYNISADASASGLQLGHHDSTNTLVLQTATDSSGIIEWITETTRNPTTVIVLYWIA